MSHRGARACNFSSAATLQCASEGELNFTSCFLAGVSVRHGTGRFNDLTDETLVALCRRIPNPDFIIVRVILPRPRLHSSS
jgi:hypothetical protein